MKLATALAAALFLFGAASADAGWFGSGGGGLPKPIDSPRLRPKLKEDHKPGKKQRHRGDWSSNVVLAETARG